MNRRQFSLRSCGLAAMWSTASLGGLAGRAGRAEAQAYPDRPVKVVVALPVGGSVDIIARLVGKDLATALGQPFVIENRAGGSGQIGLPQVARAAADGHTLMVSPASFLTTNKAIFRSLPYDPEADFAPVTRLVNQPVVLVVRDLQTLPTVDAVVAAARQAPGRLTFASSGDGSPQHLAGLLFESRTGVKMLHVPYKGGAPAINDLLGGQVDLLFAPLPEALPHLKSGKLQALGLMADQRSSLLAATPTMAELGYRDLTLSAWIALLAPAATPKAVIDRLNQAARASVSGELGARLAEMGMEVAPGTPEELRETIAREIRLHADLVKAAGLVPQ